MFIALTTTTGRNALVSEMDITVLTRDSEGVTTLELRNGKSLKVKEEYWQIRDILKSQYTIHTVSKQSTDVPV